MRSGSQKERVMTGMLVSKVFMSAFGAEMRDVMQRLDLVPDVFHLPDEAHARLPAADCEHIEVA